MIWHEISPLVTSIGEVLPEVDGMALVAGFVGDNLDDLDENERAMVSRAVPKRQREFSTGRKLARLAMSYLDLPRDVIGRDPQRRPVWPEGMVGSITHADDIAIAGVARDTCVVGFGIDLEEADRISENLYNKLLTDNEIELSKQADDRLPALIFSAKEAGYKAINPIVGKFIGFHEAEVDVDWAQRQFAIRYIGQHKPNRIMERGHGYFTFFERYVFSLFIIR